MKVIRLALYGGGKMGFAMVNGWLSNGLQRENVAIYDPNPSDELLRSKLILNPKSFDADVVVLAVKPQVMPELLQELKVPRFALVISVAAGVSIATIEKYLGKDQRIVRAMPNTPAAVGAGITAIVGNSRTSENDMDQAEGVLRAVGQVVRLEKESDMDAVTGLSGSGPAYVFYMIEAMRHAGEKLGLSQEVSHQLALATVAGAGKLALETGIDPSILRQNVTSPGGTTQAGLGVLMNDVTGLMPLMDNTILAATERSRELGETNK